MPWQSNAFGSAAVISALGLLFTRWSKTTTRRHFGRRKAEGRSIWEEKIAKPATGALSACWSGISTCNRGSIRWHHNGCGRNQDRRNWLCCCWWRCYCDSLAGLQPQLLSRCYQRVVGNFLFRRHLHIDDPLIPLLKWPQGVREKVERRYLVPWCMDFAKELLGPVAVFNDFDVPSSIVRKTGRNRR